MIQDSSLTRFHAHTREGLCESICAAYWHRAFILSVFRPHTNIQNARCGVCVILHFHGSCSDASLLCLRARCIIYPLVLSGKLPCLEPNSWKITTSWKQTKSTDIKNSQQPVESHNVQFMRGISPLNSSIIVIHPEMGNIYSSTLIHSSLSLLSAWTLGSQSGSDK